MGTSAVAVPGALGLSLRAVTERGHRNPRTWHSSHSEWPRAEEAALRVPPSQDDTKDTRACSGGPHGSRHGAVVILRRQLAEHMGTVLCVLCVYVCVCVYV